MVQLALHWDDRTPAAAGLSWAGTGLGHDPQVQLPGREGQPLQTRHPGGKDVIPLLCLQKSSGWLVLLTTGSGCGAEEPPPFCPGTPPPELTLASFEPHCPRS